jgi:hypothetical protein
MILPTVGRIVHYHPRPGEKGVTVPDTMGQPCAAIVAHVNPDGTVNLGVFDRDGHQYGRRGVQLIQEGSAHPQFGDWCEWMQYQKDVAAGRIAPTLHATKERP